MASWYEPTGPMKLTAITAQYVGILTAGLANGSMGELVEPGSVLLKSAALMQG
jgi:hypothetical protein